MRLGSICEYLFTDICALDAASEILMQAWMNTFPSAHDNFDLMISTKKSEVLYQPTLVQSYLHSQHYCVWQNYEEL